MTHIAKNAIVDNHKNYIIRKMIAMSNFQTQAQSQWENESINEEILAQSSSNNSNNNKKSHHKIYILITVFFIIALISIISVYTFARSIEGTWIRQADDHTGAEGMAVEVVKNGSVLEGKVIADSDDPTKFKEGQIKWFQLRKVGFGTYECFDLCLDEETNAFYYDDTVSTLTILSGGNTLILDAPKHTKGAHQMWVKQK